jgi:antitoxin ParD1/3/4
MPSMAKDPNTVTMNVSLPQFLKRYVDRKVSSGIYGSASELVREAIREKRQRDQERDEVKSLLADKLLAGLESGKPIAFTDDYIDAKKRALTRRSGKSRSA